MESDRKQKAAVNEAAVETAEKAAVMEVKDPEFNRQIDTESMKISPEA
ncbi:MAG: hypothetical protein GY696_26275 [Gammaproteobacteria bacterium]|nr:hypothetical protein [Gammaproteobacteria bacterium]